LRPELAAYLVPRERIAAPAIGNKFVTCDLILQDSFKRGDVELAERLFMNSRINADFEHIDHKTSRSICDAVGERLQQSMHPETSLTPHLQRLLDEMRRREEQGLH
jgi:hypothetical protein